MGFSSRIRISISLFLLFVASNFLFLACGIKKPQAPSWYSDWSLPLINRQIDMAEILSRFDDSNVYYDSAGNPGINLVQPIDTVLIDDQLTIGSARLGMKDSLGTVNIESPDGVQSTLLLESFFQPSMGYVPPTGFDFAQDLEPLDRFDWAVVDSGLMRLSLFNALEVDLDTVVVTIIDASDSRVIGVAVFQSGLEYLESQVRDINLAGQRISNSILLSYHGHTPGGPLLNVSGQYLRATVSFSQTLTVSSARAEIPRITRTKSDLYEIEDSTEVQEAVISSGLLSFDVFNDTDLPCAVNIHSPNFRLYNSDFTVNGQLAPHSHRTMAIDIAGYSFIPQGINPQRVLVEMVNVISASAPARYTFQASDSLSLDLDVSEISFQTLTGRIKPAPIDIEPVTRSMELPDGIDQSRLTNATLDIAIINNSQVPASLDLDLTGGGKLITLNGIVAAKASPNSPPVTTLLSATPDQTREFFDPPPDQIVISGGGVINPDFQTASLSRGDYFVGELTIRSPFALAIDDTISFSPEIGDVAMDDSRPNDIGDRILNGSLRAVLENRLPLGTRVKLFFGNRADSSLYTDTSSFTIGPYTLGPAVVGPSGTAVQPTISMISDTIDNTHLWLFERDSVYIGQVIELFPTDSSGILINGSDYIGIRAVASLKIRIGD